MYRVASSPLHSVLSHTNISEPDVIHPCTSRVQPLAYWEFEDCFTYAEREGFPLHPLHEQGYPSMGDVQSTIPVPREKWFEYGMERSGRFQGYQNADGSSKTECGIHTIGQEDAPDLWQGGAGLVFSCVEVVYSLFAA